MKKIVKNENSNKRTFEFNGKTYEEVVDSEFTFEQFEVAEELLIDYNEAMLPFAETNDKQSASEFGLQVMRTLRSMRLQIPFTALLFKEKGSEWTFDDYEQNKELFKRLPVDVFKTVIRERVINFLAGGGQYMMECSLLPSPAEKVEASVVQ